MNRAIELVERIESIGGVLVLQGDSVTYDLPAEIDLEELRAHRNEVVRVLQRRRQEVPAMPPGVRLIRWGLKEPPVAIEMCTTVVINPARFAKSTLLQLQAALKGKRWLAGHWSAAELVERLKHVGVEVELE